MKNTAYNDKNNSDQDFSEIKEVANAIEAVAGDGAGSVSAVDDIVDKEKTAQEIIDEIKANNINTENLKL